MDYQRRHEYVSLKFWQVPDELVSNTRPFEAAMAILRRVLPQVLSGRDKQIEEQALKQSATDIEKHRQHMTVVEAVTPMIWRDDFEASVDAAMSRCIEVINEFIDAAVTVTGDVRIEPLTWANAYSFCPVVLRTAEADPDPKFHGPLLFLMNLGVNVARGAAELQLEQLEQISIVLSRSRRGDPFQQMVARLRSAERALLMQGDMLSVVVQAQIACEIMLNTLMLMMAWEKQVPPPQATSWFDDGLAKRVRSRFSVLGGDWDTTKPELPVGRWYREVYIPRNRALHSGWLPDEATARAAIESTHVLIDFIKTRLADPLIAKSYPRTCLLILGVPGLERAQALSRRIRRFIDEAAPVEPDWIASFADYVSDIEALNPQT